MILFHHTCRHSVERIGDGGLLIPQPQPLMGNRRLLWLTQTMAPARTALGLTSYSLTCDRTEHTYQVAEPVEVYSWAWWRSQLPRESVWRLEAARGTRPQLWWATEQPQVGELVR